MATKSEMANGTVFEDIAPTTSDPGIPIVLVHGLGLSRATWDDHVDALSQRHRVISYDLFGHGESANPPRTADLTVFSEQIVQLLDELDIDQASIVGFSLGGMINRRLAIDHPERVHSLAIFNSPHERGDEAQRAVEERAAASAAGGPGATIDATLVRWFTEDFRASSPDIVEKVKAGVLANDPPVYAECRWVLANGVVELIAPQPPITKPTLVMTCENDTGSTPAMSHAIAAETDGAQTIIVPRLQHLGLLEAPHLFTEPLLDFLAELDPAPSPNKGSTR